MNPDDTPWPDDAVEVGRILDAWGVKGWFKVQPYAAQPEALFGASRWFLRTDPADRRPARSEQDAAVPRVLQVTGARRHGDVVVATSPAIRDRQAAQALKGACVFVSRASFPTPDDGEYYWVDLIGLTVLNREGQTLGVVEDLLHTGPGCVLRVKSPATDASDAAERLIPFVEAYVDAVDLPGRRILVDWGPDFD